ncbi:MAG: serine/threonine protein kinase [Verrucomicrobiales bacterium]
MAQRHTIGEIVATGSRGVVYRAREGGTGREVALKRLRPELVHEGDTRDHFMFEARLTAVLEHPNVVPVHTVTQDVEGIPFYTMKLVRGSSLAKVLSSLAENDGRTSKIHTLTSLLTVFQKVCDAVAFAHSKGLAHRNLNSANIMIGEYGEVLLLGWGRPMARDTAGPSHDQADDNYALGALLHEILHLEPVFPGRELPQPSEVGATASPSPPPTGRRPHLPGGKVPASLTAVTKKALAPDPARRYPRVQALQADIRAYQNGFATAAESAGPWRQFMLLAARHRDVSIALGGSLTLIACLSALYGMELLHANRSANAERSLAFEALKTSEVETKRAESALGKLSYLGPEFFSNAAELMKDGRFPEALELLGYAVDVEPNNADYQLAQAHLQQASEQLTEAVASYQRVLQLRPDPAAQMNLELSQQLLMDGGGSRPLSPAQRARLAQAIISQGRSAESPTPLFRTEE